MRTFKLLSLPALALMIGIPMLNAQTAGGEGVLQGTRVEVGVNACGVYAANASTLTALGGGPEGPFNNTETAGLGAVYKTESGAPVPLCGDYWVPGSPEESFGIQFSPSGTVYKNGSLGCSPNGIAGSIGSYTDGGGQRSLQWNGFISSVTGDTVVAIEQITTLGVSDRFFTTEIRLRNAGTAALDDLFYARSVDPDNDQASTGTFNTNNSVFSQASGLGSPSVVEAIGNGGSMCYMALASADPRSRVAIGISGLTFSLTRPADVWFGNPSSGYSDTGSVISDWSVSIAFRIEDFLPGQSDTFRYAHVFDPLDLPAALSNDSTLSCLPPFNLRSEVASNKANLRWDGYANHAAYKIFGGEAGMPPNILIRTADSLRANGLTPGTSYQWTVRAQCDDGSLSDSAPVESFTTPLFRGMALAGPVSLYPNPASGPVALSGEALAEYQQLNVYSLAGRRVWTQAIGSSTVLMLDATLWPSGMYTVELVGGTGTPQRLRLLVP